MVTEQVNWIGRTIGDHVVGDLICNGPFSWVHTARSSSENELTAVKISKPFELAGDIGDEVVFPTRALTENIGVVSSLKPDCAQLLLLQSEKLRAMPSEYLVAVKDVICREDLCILHMEFLAGTSLRELINAGPLSLSLVVKIAQALETLTGDDRFGYHGDVKPDNIMVEADGIKLLDPGHFGPLDCNGGVVDDCIVTSPSYYPFLVPDDLFALGVICWESACRSHPFDGTINSQQMDVSGVTDELFKFVRSRELSGNYFLTPILQAVRPSAIRPDLPTELEEFLLKSMRLQVRADGKLDLASGFAGFSEMIAALQSLAGNDILHL